MAPLGQASRPEIDNIDLFESAAICERRITALRKHAINLKLEYTSGKKRTLLDDVITRSNSNIKSLRAWTVAVRQGRQTSSYEIRASINEVFNNILLLLAKAKKALDHRLQLSCLAWPKSKKTSAKAVWSALDEIKGTIGYLHNQVKTILRDTPDQKGRKKKLEEVVQTRHKSYHIFRPALDQMPEAEKRFMRFGTYGLLWDQFPAKLDLEGNVGDVHNPGDGKIYKKESITEVSNILNAFYRAWSDATVRDNSVNRTSPDPIRRVGKITDTAKICLILRGMKQQRLLDCFCDHSKNDMHLPFKPENLRDIFGQGDANHAETFCAEQYRAIPRTWNDGEHIKLADAEPLPLIFSKDYATGSYGSVKEYQHAFTNIYYACKKQNSADTRAHLQREVARLKKLKHRHIVQFVISYERGDQYGILLKPAATTDLYKLLVRYGRNARSYDREAQDQRGDRVVLKPILLTAFGCLSRGLAHIHSCNIRHKDIKPANILYEKALSPNPARFLWADFGLAHDFSDSATSKTVSRNRHRYSPRYAAPEIMEEHETRKAKRETNHKSSDNDDEENAPEHAPEGSNGAHRKSTGHGRSSDIYSFGIVFLEILSHLVEAEKGDSIPGDFNSYEPFWKNIQGLQDWAHNKIQSLPPDDPLDFLFKLSLKMIAYNATDRPVISKIVMDMAKANKGYFCSACINDPVEPISQATIAPEQMVEGRENTKKVHQNHVNGREQGRVRENGSTQQPVDESDSVRRRLSRTSIYSGGKEPVIKRSSIRAPSRHRDRRKSDLRFGGEEIIRDVPTEMTPTLVNDKQDHMPSIPSNGT